MENIGHLSKEQQEYEHRKMLHVIKKGSPLVRRGIFNRIFDILGFVPLGSLATANTPPDSKYNRYIKFSYCHLGCIVNKTFKNAFDRYLIDYDVELVRANHTFNNIKKNYGNVYVYFNAENVQWGLMDNDLKETYPDIVEVDARGCVKIKSYYRKTIKFVPCSNLVYDVKNAVPDWDKIDIVEKVTESSFRLGQLINFKHDLFSSKGFRHSKLYDMGLSLESTYYNSNGVLEGQYEILDVDKFRDAVIQYDLLQD